MKCSICKKVFEGQFYDPFPILKNGVCCESCRYGRVATARARLYVMKQFQKEAIKYIKEISGGIL